MTTPSIHNSVFIAEGAIVRGNVTVNSNSSIWFNAVVRADRSTIAIGENTNIQDNCVVHVDAGHAVSIGDYVTIGHGAIVHGCTVGNNTLIGMGAIVLNDAVIGNNCIIGAGALVPEGKIIPDNSLVIGVPGVIKRTISEEEIAHNKENAIHYVNEAIQYI